MIRNILTTGDAFQRSESQSQYNMRLAVTLAKKIQPQPHEGL